MTAEGITHTGLEPSLIEPRALTRGYTREPVVLRELAELGRAGPAELWRRAGIADYRHPQWLRPESLVCVLRGFVLNGNTDEAWRVAILLVSRVKRTVQRRMAAWPELGPDAREEIMDAIATELFTEWMSLDPAEEFWEVRFGVCLARAVSDEIARRIRVSRTEVALAPGGDDEGGEVDPWGAVPDVKAPDIETLAIVAAALEQLVEPLRTAFRMYYYLGATEDDIAAHLGCTSRTVRNYLARSRERLREWRET